MAVSDHAEKRRDRALLRLDDITTTHSQIEDLNNRGRRHNIRIRGVLESVSTDNIRPALSTIFNNLIDRPEQSPTDFDRAHRALRPRAPDGNPPETSSAVSRTSA